MRLLIAICLISLAGCVVPPSKWSDENLGMEIAYQAVHVVDLGQTLDIKRHPGLKEDNWFMGEHPSDSKVLIWYAGTALGHGFVTSAFENEHAPRWLCRTWQIITIGDAVNTVYGNYKLGVKVVF